MADVAVRPLTAGDLPAVAALRRLAFSHSEQTSDASLAAYLEALLFRSPIRDPALPSLVATTDDGAIVGFVGVTVRPVRFRGATLRMATPTQLMVHPDHRGVVGTRLLKHVIAGPQDLIYGDAATDGVARLWQLLGGRIAQLYNLFWTRALRPVRLGAAALGSVPAARAMRLAARPLMVAADAIATRTVGSAYRLPASALRAEPLTGAAMAEHWPRIVGRAALAPVYDAATASWHLRELAERRTGALHARLLRDGTDEVVGWYVYFARAGDVGDVAQVVAVNGRLGEVLDHLFAHASAAGCIALRGRAEPAQWVDLGARRCTLAREGPWTLAHSRREDVLAAILQGDAVLTRLDGEYVLRF